MHGVQSFIKGHRKSGVISIKHSMIITVKPVLSDHAWAKKKWSLNRGGLLIEVQMHSKASIGTRPSGP